MNVLHTCSEPESAGRLCEEHVGAAQASRPPPGRETNASVAECVLQQHGPISIARIPKNYHHHHFQVTSLLESGPSRL